MRNRRPPFVPAAVLAAALAAALAGPSAAVVEPESRVEHVPPGTGWIAGHEPLSPASFHTPPPAAFTAAHGDAWSHRRLGPNGQFRHLWGEGIPVDPAAMDDDAVAVAVAEQFWAEHAYLLPDGVSPGDLEPWSVVVDEGVRYVSHRQTVDGVPVLRASTFVAIRAGRLFWLGVRCFGDPWVDGAVEVDGAEAVAVAAAALRERGIGVRGDEPALALFPHVFPDRVELRRVYAVDLRAPAAGWWTAYVDARDGGLVALRDNRLFMNGHVQLRHYDRNPQGGFTTSPAAHLQITTGDGPGHADIDGGFAASGGSTTLSAEIRGPYCNVDNQAGGDLTWNAGSVSDGQTVVWEAGGGEFGEAQLAAYRFHTDVRDYLASFQPGVGWLNQTMTTYVNLWDTCNAYWDGNINFLRYGSGCNNTAHVADIVYHETGHGFHYESVIWGVGDFDSSCSEGFADTMSFLLTGDHLMGVGFYTSGSALRDVEPDMVYPDDLVWECHHDGLIVGGALWDLRKALIALYGDAQGQDVMGELYVGTVKTTSDIPSSYEAALAADDDNGNLADGTPHICQIDATFAPHGLATGNTTYAGLSIDFEPVAQGVEPDTPTPVEATVTPTSVECSDAQVGEVRLVYSTDGGHSWDSEALQDIGGDAYAGELPAVPEGTQLRYRIEADELTTGNVIRRPDNPADPAYYLYVGGLAEILCDDLEGGEGGWTHALLAGENVEGADDWMWGSPSGNGGDPDHCHSGGGCWGNDLALDPDFDGMYQNDRVNTLISPVWDLSQTSTVRLQFRRWLQVEDGVYDHARIYVNEQEVWDNAAGSGEVHHTDREWVLFDLDITPWAAGDPEVQIRWEIDSDQGLQMGGWNLDDVCLYDTTEWVGDDDAGDDDDDDGDDDGAPGDDDDGADDDDGFHKPPGVGGDAGACQCEQGVSAGFPVGALVVTLLLLVAAALLQGGSRKNI